MSAVPQISPIKKLSCMPQCVRELRNYKRLLSIWEDYCDRDEAMGSCFPKQDAAFWEIINDDDHPAGVYYGTEIITGVRAAVNIVIWDRSFLGQDELHRQMMRHFMLIYDLHRLQTTCYVDNIASQRFQERLGFFRECTMKNYGFKDGVAADAVQYAITRAELF